MRLSHLAILPLLVGASPAFAQQNSLDLVARLLGGLADGGKSLQGALGTGMVKRIADGAFEVTFDKGVAKFVYDEPQTCIFTQHAQMDGEPSSDARLDFTLVTGVDIRDQGQWEGLNAALITLNGPPETLQIVMGDKLVPQQPAFAFLASNITLEEFQAAADELLRTC